MNQRIFDTLCGHSIHRLGIGTGRLASLGSGYSVRDAAKLLSVAVDLGVNLIDTADSYGSTDCESLLGKLIRDHGEHFLLSTKAGYPYCELPRPLCFLNQVGKKMSIRLGARLDFSPDRIGRCIEGSLRRLRRDRLDFFLLHDPPSPVWQEEGLRRILERAISAGKIRHFGISSSRATIHAACRSDSMVELVQAPVNPLQPSPDAGSLPVVANHVFGAGSLLNGESPLRGILEELARRHHCSTRDILIAFAARQPGVRCVLSGTGRAGHLRENARSLEIPFSEEDLQHLQSPPSA